MLKGDNMTITRLVAILLLASLLIAIQIIYATPYVGFYYDCTPFETTGVVLNFTFYPTDPSFIPPDNRLNAVISVATGNIVNGNVELSGYVYQLGANLINGTVIFAPQLWHDNNITMITRSRRIRYCWRRSNNASYENCRQ